MPEQALLMAGPWQVRDWEALMRTVQKEAAGADEGWLARHTKPCGGCGARIQRNGGCNHIVCTRCRRHFCWVRARRP